MGINALKNISRFIALVLFQALLVNHLNIDGGLVVPLVYPLAMLLLPVNISRISLMLVGFIMGVCMDIFCGTYGLHTSAMITLGFARPYVLGMFSPREGYDNTKALGPLNYGWLWTVKYLSVGLAVHHFWLFNLENFQFFRLPETQIRVISSVVISVLICSLLLLTFNRVGEKKRWR